MVSTAAVVEPTKEKRARDGRDSRPPFNPGDRLTRAEFERRYHAYPEIKKAELIEGVVYMPSPTRHTLHGRPHAQIMSWLGVYWAAMLQILQQGLASAEHQAFTKTES